MKIFTSLPLAICALSLAIALPNTYAQRSGSRSGTPSAANAVNRALPKGVNISNASNEQLKEAVAKAVLANPSRAAEIAAAAIAEASLNQATVIADAIGQLFILHPDIADLAPSIAIAISHAIFDKPGSLDQRATEAGSALSTLAYHFAPHDPANSERIILVSAAALAANPQLDYTAQVYQILTQSLATLGASPETLANLQNQVLSTIGNAAVRDQIASINQAPGLPRPPFGTGQILVTETKVDNG